MGGNLQSLGGWRQTPPAYAQRDMHVRPQPCPLSREWDRSRRKFGRFAMSKSVVLVTGGLTGIGRATALAFARQGDIVVVSGRREVEGKALEAELRGFGAEAAFIAADGRHEDEIRRLVDQTVARFGRIDIAVNNAG